MFDLKLNKQAVYKRFFPVGTHNNEIHFILIQDVANGERRERNRFSALADSRVDLRAFGKKSLQPVAADALDIIGMASLVDAWECAKVRMEARHKAEAEAVLCGMPKVVARTELGQLRGLFKQSSNVALFFAFLLCFF